MFVRKRVFLPFAIAFLSLHVSAAALETQNVGPDARTTRPELQSSGDRLKSRNGGTSVPRATEPQTRSAKPGPTNSRDFLLRVKTGPGDVVAQSTRAISKPDLNSSIHTEKKPSPGTGSRENAKESGSAGIWAVLLMGAGLIWFQLRRKNRRNSSRLIRQD
jgi:hypothetical protein